MLKEHYDYLFLIECASHEFLRRKIINQRRKYKYTQLKLQSYYTILNIKSCGSSLHYTQVDQIQILIVSDCVNFCSYLNDFQESCLMYTMRHHHTNNLKGKIKFLQINKSLFYLQSILLIFEIVQVQSRIYTQLKHLRRRAFLP